MKTQATATFETVVRELNTALNLIVIRQQMAKSDRDRAVEARNFAGAGTYDGMLIGLMAAETIVRDSIKANEQRQKFSQDVDNRIADQLAGHTRVDPRGSVGERRGS